MLSEEANRAVLARNAERAVRSDRFEPASTSLTLTRIPPEALADRRRARKVWKRVERAVARPIIGRDLRRVVGVAVRDWFAPSGT